MQRVTLFNMMDKGAAIAVILQLWRRPPFVRPPNDGGVSERCGHAGHYAHWVCQAGHRDETPEVLQRAFVFHLEQQILPARIVNIDRLLRWLVNINLLVPPENETPVRQRREKCKPAEADKEGDTGDQRAMRQ